MALDAMGVANSLVRSRPGGEYDSKNPGSRTYTNTSGAFGSDPDNPQSAYDRSTSPSINPSDVINVVQHVKQLFYRARQVRRPMVEKWMKHYQVVHNQTWGTGRATWMPSPEVPEIYPILASLIGWETDQRPTFEVYPAALPYSPAVQMYEQLSSDLQVLMQTSWHVEDYDAEIEKMLWDAKMYGTGILKTVWDPTLVSGMGDVMIHRIDPWTFYPDPDARSMKDASHFIEVYTISAQELDKRFPGSLDHISEFGGWTEDSDQSPTMTDVGSRGVSAPKANPGALSPNTSAVYGLPGQTNRVSVTQTQGITVFEAWLRVPCSTTSSETDELGNKKDITRRYDAWRCVVVAGNCVLFDEMAENIYEHGQHPYDRYVPHDQGEFWGQSMVELLAPSQISINKLLAAIEQNIWLMGNPVWKEDTRSGLERQTITNRPGQRLRVNAGSQSGWENPPQMHPQISSDLIKFYISEMERISGLSAIVRGATPEGRNGESVMDSVQEAAFVRIRLGLRSLERVLVSAGMKIGSLIADFYNTPRIMAIVGPQGQQTSMALRPNHFYTPTPQGLSPMRFQILIRAGSMVSRGQRVQEADTLFAMGAIDAEAVLEAHSFPNRQIVVGRMRALAEAGLMQQPPGARQRAGRSS